MKGSLSFLKFLLLFSCWFHFNYRWFSLTHTINTVLEYIQFFFARACGINFPNFTQRFAVTGGLSNNICKFFVRDDKK
jgi:hypothetical protein